MMVAMLTVTNRSRRPFEVNLLRGVDYGFDHMTPFSMPQPASLPDGTPGVTVIEKQLPGSVFWAAGETKDVPDDLLQIQEFRAARNAGILVVVQTR